MRVRSIASLMGVLVVLLAPAAQASEDTATVTLLHGIPYGPSGVDVDVHVDGELLVEGFPAQDPHRSGRPGRSGVHDVEVFEAGADPASDSPATAAGIIDTATVDRRLAELRHRRHTLARGQNHRFRDPVYRDAAELFRNRQAPLSRCSTRRAPCATSTRHR